MSLNIPNVFVGGPGHPALASEVNANFAAIAAHFTEGAGGIKDEDISSSAAINANKLSNLAGKRVPTDRIEDNAVTGDKLKDDPAAGHANAGVNLADHIKDALIENKKLVAKTVAKDKLNYVEVTQAFSFGLASVTTVNMTEVVPAPALPAMSGMLPLAVTIEGLAITAGTVNASVALVQRAGTALYALTWQQSTAAITTLSGTIRFTYLALTTP